MTDSTHTVGRRGVAGNFFVMKAVGAAAEPGAELDALIALGKRVNSVTRTMGMLSLVYAAGQGKAALSDRGGRDGNGRGNPRGTRAAAGQTVTANEVVSMLMEAVVPDLPFGSGTR